MDFGEKRPRRRGFAWTACMAFVLGLAGLSPGLHAQTGPGSSFREPAEFSAVSAWLLDPQASLRQFEETIGQDFLFIEGRQNWYLGDVYVALEDGFGGQKLHPASLSRLNLQAMAWGPLMTTALWTPTAVLSDLGLNILAANNGEYIFPLTEGLWMSLSESLRVREEQNREAVPVNSLFRLNVLVALDWLSLDLREASLDDEGQAVWAKYGASVLGNTYMGLAVKLLETNYFFGGFSFIHYPRLIGASDFLAASGYAGSLAARVYASPDEGLSYLNFLHETRAKAFFHNNLLDLFQVRALVNLDGSALFDLLGGGLRWSDGFWGTWTADLNNLGREARWASEVTWGQTWGDLAWGGALVWDWAPQFVWREARAEAEGSLGSLGAANLAAQAALLVQNESEDLLWGGRFSLAWTLPGLARLGVEAQRNADPTMAKLGLTRDRWSLGFFYAMELEADTMADRLAEAAEGWDL